LSGRSLVFRRALRLYLFGNEAMIRPQLAFHEGLRPVFERIRKRIAPDVTDRQIFALLSKHKINSARHLGNTSVSHIPGDAHPLMQR
jgi:hypothetical protein